MKNLCYITIVVIASLAVSEASGAGLVNGDFELPVLTGIGATYSVAPVGFGWTIASGNIDLLTSAYWQPASGNQSIDLDGTTAGSIYQDFNFSSSGTWEITFDLSANPDLYTQGDGLGTGLKTVEVDFGPVGSVTTLGTYSISPVGRTDSNMQWVTITTPQVEVSDSVLYELQFTSLTPGIAGNALDNVQLQAVPEPAGGALFSAGLCILGFVMRRKSA
jgi:hypothetical protein